MSIIANTAMQLLSADVFGRPNTNPPGVVDQDNFTAYSFTLNTDSMTVKFPIPHDYQSGDLEFKVIWTNDGGGDDDGLAVKWQLDYQVSEEGDVLSGSHVNSPKDTEDTYVGAVGWVQHVTDWITISEDDFIGKVPDVHILIKLSAVTPGGAALSCEPHLLCICYRYTHLFNE